MKTLEVPTEFAKYNQKELITFLKRGRYDVEYRRARNARLKVEQAEYKAWRAKQ